MSMTSGTSVIRLDDRDLGGEDGVSGKLEVVGDGRKSGRSCLRLVGWVIEFEGGARERFRFLTRKAGRVDELLEPGKPESIVRDIRLTESSTVPPTFSWTIRFLFDPSTLRRAKQDSRSWDSNSSSLSSL